MHKKLNGVVQKSCAIMWDVLGLIFVKNRNRHSLPFDAFPRLYQCPIN